MRYRFLRYPGGLKKAITLSYDDGCRDDVKFVEIINKYGLKCTFNIVSGNLTEQPNFLSGEEIKKYLLDAGHEVAVHGERHIAPRHFRFFPHDN